MVLERRAISTVLMVLLTLSLFVSAFFVVPTATGNVWMSTDWSKTYGGTNSDYAHSVVQTSDGGYALAGYTNSFGSGYQVYLVKTFADGTMTWNKTYGGADWDEGWSVVQTSDGGYALAGYTNSFGSGYQVYLVKTFADGTIAWNKTYGGTNDDYAQCVVQTSDGGYAIAGYTFSFGLGEQVYLVKTFADGTIAWNKTYGGTGSDGGCSVVRTNDGGYVIAGFTNSFGSGWQMYLVKAFADGTMAWNKTYGGTNAEFGYSVVQTSDGGYAFAGYTYSYGVGTPTYNNVYLVKTFADGTMAWNKTYGGTNYDHGWSVAQTNDGGYAIAGYTDSFGSPRQMYLVKTFADGTMAWNKTYGGTNGGNGYSIVQTSDGGYAIAGDTYSSGYSKQAYLVKLTPQTIYIRADGSVDPPTAPIVRDGNIYTLTDNIDSTAATAIVIEKNGITLDGAGHTIQGSSGVGIDLSGRTDVTIKNAVIKSFLYSIRLSYSLCNLIQGNNLISNVHGIRLFESSSNTISGNLIAQSQNISIVLYNNSYHNTLSDNNITDNNYGVCLWGSPNNLFSMNSITGNNSTGVLFADGSSDNTLIGSYIKDNHDYGIKIELCSNNHVYHNNFIGNSPSQASILDSLNLWDDGYPSGGNYWNNYAGVDLYSGPSQDVVGNDGIGDTRYQINVNNQDNYPLMETWTPTRMRPPPTEWTKTYGGPNEDAAYSVVETDDGGYALAGSTYSFGVGTPSSTNVYLVKTFADGTMAWNKTYGGPTYDYGSSVVQTSDGGYALAGSTSSFGLGYQVYLVKTDASGTMAWNKTYGGTSGDGGYSVVQTSDGGYAIAGYTDSYGPSRDFLLVKTYASGTMAWSKTYGGTTHEWAYSVTQTSDGGYAIAGETDSFGSGIQAYLVKTFADGTMAWNKTYGGPTYDYGYSMVQTSDGGYAIAGYTDSFGSGGQAYLVKTFADGTMAWNKTYGGSNGGSALSVVQTSDGGYVIAGFTGGDLWLVKTDSAGTKQWNKTCGGPNFERARSVTQTSDGGYVIAGSTSSYGAGGSDFWLIKVAGPSAPSTEYPWPMFHHNPRHTGYTESPAPATNQTQWSYTTGNWVLSSPAVVGGRVYVGSQDRNVYCFDASTGTKIWNYTTGSEVDSSPAVADGRVYVGSYDGKIYCLSASTGEHLWDFSAPSAVEVVSSPTVADGRVYFGSADWNIYCLDAFNGAKIWNYATGGYIDSSPAVADGRVYIGSWDRNVYCLDASTGTRIWNYTTGSYVPSSPTAVDGRIYVGSYDKNIYCLDALTGVKIWNRTTGWAGRSSPAVAYGKVYVGDYDHRIYCLDAFTGTKIWNYTTSAGVSSSPAVANGRVYVGSDDDKVYCLDAYSGIKIWSYMTGGNVQSSPAIADGMVFVGSFDNKLYAFGKIVRAENYATIQAAVDAAPPQATVIIQPGTYRESVVINKPLTIMGKKGSSTDFEGGGTGIAIKITGTYDVTVTNVVITNWNKGILIENSAQCKVYSNIMYCMVGSGIAVTGSSAVSNNIYSNDIHSNNIAINITTSSTSNTIHDNTISLNSIGINIESNGNTVYANTISQNNIGIKVFHSISNMIYWNNFINNIQVHIEPGQANAWDDGFPAGGNYWSDYKSQNPEAEEYGTSGIWNIPYRVDDFNIDNYPLMYPAQEINVTKVTPFKILVGQGCNIRINVTITNRGKYTEIVKITLYANTILGTQLTNIIMPSRTSKNVTLTWNTIGVPYGSYPMSAQADPIPGETDSTNNMRTGGSITVTVVGDANGDGRVDLLDLYSVGKKYGSTSSTSNWYPNCDFNDDDKVDPLDLSDLSKNYGKMI